MALSIKFRSIASTGRGCGVAAILIAPMLFSVACASELPLHDVPGGLAVRKELAPPPAGTIELKFKDLYKMPVGPRGLEPSDVLREADGKQVRLIGFMVREETGGRDGLLLTSVPVATGDEDESLADDLPPALIRIAYATQNGQSIPYLPGLLQVSGTLRLQPHVDSSSQRISAIQIEPDRSTRRALARAVGKSRAAQPAH